MKLTALLAFFLLASPAYAACNERNVVTDGATLGALTANGRPIVSLEGVGGVTIRHRGDESGALTSVRACDEERATRIRARLEQLLSEAD
jgi:hypothetical protein